jgi:hypothetical protein
MHDISTVCFVYILYKHGNLKTLDGIFYRINSVLYRYMYIWNKFYGQISRWIFIVDDNSNCLTLLIFIRCYAYWILSKNTVKIDKLATTIAQETRLSYKHGNNNDLTQSQFHGPSCQTSDKNFELHRTDKVFWSYLR